MDMFTPVVPPERFHPNYANCLARRNPWNEAVVARWADGFIDRDGKFVGEFQTTFNSCFWELYLHAVLKKAGCVIDFAHHAPDFVVTDPVPFAVEATVALNAKDAPPEWTPLHPDLRPRDLNEFNRVAMVRLLNSISEKTKKYHKSYRHLPHVSGKPFVLAVTPFDQPFFYLQVHRAVEAVLYDHYVDEQDYLDDPSRFSSLGAKNLKAVRKSGTAELPLGIFNDPSHAHISAVVFNSSATWGKVRALGDDPNPFVFFTAVRADPATGDVYVFRGPKARYSETLFDGLRVYHNPHATHPLDWRVFQEPGAFQAVCVDPVAGEWKWWTDRPALVARNLVTLNAPAGADAEELAREAESLPEGGWQKLQFTPSLIEEMSAAQRGERPDAARAPERA